MSRTLLLASLSVLALSAGASAQDEPRFTLGAGYERVDADGAEFDTVVLRAGYDFTRYLGVEGQVHFGIGDETITDGGITADLDLNHSAGLFGVVRPWSNEQANVFLRVGYTTTEVEASAAGFSVEADDDAWAYGVGGEWFFAGNNGVRFDYTRFDFEDGDADVFGLSYVRRFGG